MKKNCLLWLSCILYIPFLMHASSSSTYGYYHIKPDFGRISRIITQEIDALLEPFKQKPPVRIRLQKYKEEQVLLVIKELKNDVDFLSVEELERKALDFSHSIIYEFVKKEMQNIIAEEFQHLRIPYSIRSQIIVIINDEIEGNFFALITNNQRVTELLQELPKTIAQRVAQLARVLA